MARKIIRRARKGTVGTRLTLGWDSSTLAVAKKAALAEGISLALWVRRAVALALEASRERFGRF